MKHLVVLVFSFFAFECFAIKEWRIPSDYSIGESKIDSSLSMKEAVFVFALSFNDNQIGRDFIYYSIDGVKDTAEIVNNSFSLLTKPGVHSMTFSYNGNYNDLRIDTITIEKQFKVNVVLYFTSLRVPITVCKPVIYLYPEKETKVNVQVNPVGEFNFTYPVYENGWDVTANATGQIIHKGTAYHYLFWDAIQSINPIEVFTDQGFVVDGINTLSFLEEKLTIFGFTSQEKADFITYWGPILSKEKKNRVQFVVNEDCDQFATLKITPTPQNVYRFYILSSPIESQIELQLIPQVITPMNRKGFTVLEWGGSVILQQIN